MFEIRQIIFLFLKKKRNKRVTHFLLSGVAHSALEWLLKEVNQSDLKFLENMYVIAYDDLCRCTNLDAKFCFPHMMYWIFGFLVP